jgi:PAS domain S-box-containing protein
MAVPTNRRPKEPSSQGVHPEDLGIGALAKLVEQSLDGIALLDEELRFVYVNPAGCDILGYRPEQLIGQPGLFLVTPERRTAGREFLQGTMAGRPGHRSGPIVRPDGQERQIEATGRVFEADGRRMLAGIFRDVTDLRRTERWTAAFAQIAASIAYAQSLEEVLDDLAGSAVAATGMVACAVILLGDDPPRFRVAGTRGLPPDYGQRFEAALAAGLDLPALRAFRTRQTVVVQRAPEDPDLTHLEELDRELPWDTIACIPMVVRERTVGALKGFFGPGRAPDQDGMAVLAAIAHQAAVAVDNARLFAEATAASRRQEALVQAGLALTSELSLPAVLEKIVSLACEVADASYGAVGVLGADGLLEDFITFGVTDEQRQAIGHLPVGKGILGVLITDARPIRLRRIQDDPRSVGFPPHHPPMTSFLGVPISVRGRLYGNLYLTDKRGAAEFTEEDERAVVTLATQAGVAIENARLFAEAQDQLALQERHRLARELHDSVSQALFSLTLQTRAAQLLLEREGLDPTGAIGGRMAKLRELTDGALAEMRALIFELRPEALREEGLLAAVRKQAEGLSAREELSVVMEAPEDRIALPDQAEEQLYRLAQEALNNVVKHAQASRVRIRFQLPHPDADQLILEVSDDGIGFDPSVARPGHMGLRTMAERAASLGGTLEVSSAPGSGTTVRAAVPLQTAEPLDPRSAARSAVADAQRQR